MTPRPQTARARHYLRMKNLPRIALAALLAVPIASFAQSSVQVGFSPEGSARKLVLDTIASAKTSIHVLAECQVACCPVLEWLTPLRHRPPQSSYARCPHGKTTR